METLRYKLFALFTLFTLLTLLPPLTLFTLVSLSKFIGGLKKKGYYAHTYNIKLYAIKFMGFCAKSGVGKWMDTPDCYDYEDLQNAAFFPFRTTISQSISQS